MPLKSTFKDPLRDATVNTLKRVVDPLVELMFDAGITVREFGQIVRERAVRGAAARVSRETGRDSKSRIAIVTGLPRSEVARILRSDDKSTSKGGGEHPARKVLSAWFDSPRFLSPNGEPAVLPIFGKKRTFEQLVAMYSGGIPVRAMLDELVQIDAVERLSDQRVKAKSRIPVMTGLSSGAIEALGERASDLLATLTFNLKRKSKPLFEGTALLDDADCELVPLLRSEINEQCENFINSANALLGRSRARPNRPARRSNTRVRVGVTVYYFQDNIENDVVAKTGENRRPRKNLQRRRRPSVRSTPETPSAL